MIANSVKSMKSRNQKIKRTKLTVNISVSFLCILMFWWRWRLLRFSQRAFTGNSAAAWVIGIRFACWGCRFFCINHMYSPLLKLLLVKDLNEIVNNIPKINFVYNSKCLAVFASVNSLFNFSSIARKCPTWIAVIANNEISSFLCHIIVEFSTERFYYLGYFLDRKSVV